MFPEKSKQSVQVALGNLALHPQRSAVCGIFNTGDRIEGITQALLSWRERHNPAEPSRRNQYAPKTSWH
jgi:hypothetical protein